MVFRLQGGESQLAEQFKRCCDAVERLREGAKTNHCMAPVVDAAIDAVLPEDFSFEDYGSIHDHSGICFEYSGTTSNTEGVLYYIGTEQGTTTWQNPHDRGLVVCTGTRAPQRHYGARHHSQNAQFLVGRSRQDAGWCNDGVADGCITCDLKGFKVRPTGYTLGDASCCAPSNWRLDGSADGANYVTLHTASNDVSLKPSSTTHFAVSGVDGLAFYEFFRLTCTGKDQAGGSCFCFHICNFELYGQLQVE